MGKTPIEWTDLSWSPLRVRVKFDAAEIAQAKGYTSLVSIAEKMAGHVGPHCEKVSAGCENCYSESNNHRCLPSNGTGLAFDRRSRDLVTPYVDEKILRQPLGWRGSKRIFVENQSDLFGEWVPDEQIDRVFAIAALCPQHTFQILTKRPERMRAYMAFRSKSIKFWERAAREIGYTFIFQSPLDGRDLSTIPFPLRNVWLGVSAEDQQSADTRIPVLLKTPAAVRFVSYEPALGPIDFTNIQFRRSTWYDALQDHDGWGLLGAAHKKLDWVIAGYESGTGARPAQEEWIRSAKNQCRNAGVSFFYKQAADSKGKKIPTPLLDGRWWKEFPEVAA